ncbi:choice-of-anchor P family protein [Actinomycetes bacterium KLBMP 9797]
MKTLRMLVTVSVGGALLAVPARAAAADLAGFTLAAEAAPIAVQIFEPTIPVPAEPQLELNLSYSRATLSSGPVGRAVSSLMWPGDAVGYGLPELLQNPDATYPVKVDAAHPSGPADAEQEVAPGAAMTSHAEGDAVEAAAHAAKHATPALAVPGLPIPPVLVAMEGFSSRSKTTVAGDKATAVAYATAGSIALLGGLVKVNGLRADTESVSDGGRGTTTGTVAFQSLTLAGQTVALNQDGLAAPLGTTKLPAVPAALTARLADLGLSIDVPAVGKKGDRVTGHGLTVTLDTAALLGRLTLTALLDPLLALLPADLRTQLVPWLNLAPRFVFVLGTATSQATATPAVAAEAPPPAAAPPAAGSTGDGSQPGGGDAGSGVAGGGDAPAEAGPGDATTPVASHEWPVFPGVPWYAFVLGFAVAAAVSFGLRRYAALVFGGADCDLGVPTAVPDLRVAAKE